MGKLAKQKKRKLLDEITKSKTQVTHDELLTTIKTLSFFSQNKDLLLKSEFKPLRKVLFELSKQSGSLINQVSDALRDGRWDDAIYSLTIMRAQNKVPKLGAVQRWTRDCDAAGEHSSSQSIKVLDAILRTSDPDMIGVCTPCIKEEYPIRMHATWSPPINGSINGSIDESIDTNSSPAEIDDSTFLPVNMKSLYPYLKGFNTNEAVCGFKLIYKELGENRAPPNQYDMNLYYSIPGTISGTTSTPINRIDVPNLPGVFVLQNVLSKFDCSKIISCAEKIGFTPDVPKGGSAKELSSILAHNFFWLVDEEFVNYVYERCKPYLPQIIDNGSICGLNARWRVYRYQPGSIYRPHIDGAWPGSGINSKGEYIYDAYGDRWSKLTFLIRLNENFNGGATTYFTPSVDVGYLDAQPVSPAMGDVLVFPHGDTRGTILHEGSAVLDTNGLLGDAKYVIRTEVLYTISGHKRKILD
jgi:hypothetical protein